MPARVRLLSALLLLALPLAPARAYCEYRGVMGARTTLSQEFRDSRWVVRVRLLSTRDNFRDPRVLAGEAAPGTRYRLQLVRAYKGRPPSHFTYYTERNSGAFYLDRPGTGPDIGGEYLLFLTPLSAVQVDPWGGRHRLRVNYSCGQSRPWARVSAADRRLLATLSRRR